MQELLNYIISNIVDEGVDFKISNTETEDGVLFEIDLPEEYIGKVIGKGGQNIKAIRDVIGIIARKSGQRVFVKVK